MPENQEIREGKKDSRFSKDLLQRFMCGGGERHFPANPKGESPENVELGLGLSLNGRFGVEPKRLEANNKLFRASSVANLLTFPATADEPVPFQLTRTCSLPAETEEWRKRKELQSLRRSEAKKRRFEKLKNLRVVKRKPAEDWGSNKNGMESKGSQQAPVPAASLLPPPPQFSSQGSVGSDGSGESSGVSEFESQLSSGTNKDREPKRSPAEEPHAPHRAPTRPTEPSPNRTGSTKIDPGSYNSSTRSAQSRPESSFRARPDDDTSRVMSGDMPCVSTKGDGPEGKKVDGFLYRYKKGEVRIVCVCHGSFLTPAEFVKHAGGGDVEHPLRRIIVNPPSFW